MKIHLNNKLSFGAFHASTFGLLSSSYATKAYELKLANANKVHALDRKILEWRYLVDWNLQRQRPMVVIDPNDPEALMYLSERDYRDLQRVCLSNDLPLTVVARKGTTPPSGYNGDLASDTAEADKSENSSTTTNTGAKPSQNSPLPGRKTPHFISNGMWTQVRRSRSWISTRLIELKIGVDSSSLVDLGEPKQLFQLMTMWGRQTLHYLELGRPGYRMTLIDSFCRHLAKIWRTQGLHRVVALMKIYIFVIYSYLGGDPLKSTDALGIRVRLSNGLPKCFPVDIRNQLRTGSVELVRWWISVLNAYKALRTSYDLEGCLNSITAPEFTGNYGPWSDGMIPIWSSLCDLIGYVPRYNGGFSYGRFSPKSGPNCSIAILGMSLDAYAWTQSKTDSIFRLANHWAPTLEMKLREEAAGVNDPIFTKVAKPILSKLALIFESGGKIRPVAILDIWTQWLLHPFHEFLFGILRKIPTDATFDQEGVLSEYVKKFTHEDKHFCYDLKNATDRIPLRLYIEMFIPLLGREIANLWGELLSNRTFTVPKPTDDVSFRRRPKTLPKSVRYTRGQPMGAYSSWASLALVHHFLVQHAARECGHTTWFLHYLVLGDDIVISEESVALAYLRQCELYGITVGVAKSLTSKGLVNFASKTYTKGENVSPLSLKEELSAKTWSARVALATRVLDLWYNADKSGTKLLRRVTSNVSWTWLQSELQAQTRGGLVTGLQLVAQNPLATAKVLNADLIKTWLETYVLNRSDKSVVVTEHFARDLCALFVRKARESANDSLESALRFLGILQVAFEKLALAANFQMGIGLYQILAVRAQKFASHCEQLVEQLDKLEQEYKPVTKTEVASAQANLRTPNLNDPRELAIQLKAFSKAFKKMMYPKGVSPTIGGQKMENHLSKEQLLSQFLPRAVSLWIEAQRWAVVPLKRYRSSSLWVDFLNLDRFGLGYYLKSTKERRFPVPTGIPYFLDLKEVFTSTVDGKVALHGELPEGWKVRWQNVSRKVNGLLTKVRIPHLSFQVPDISFLLREPTEPGNPDSCRLPYKDIEELCLRHFGRGASLPDLILGKPTGRRDSDRLLRALSAYEAGGPPKATIERSPIEDRQLRLLAAEMDYLYRKNIPSSMLDLEETFWKGYRESPSWTEGDTAVVVQGYDPATWQEHWHKSVQPFGPVLLASVATAVADNTAAKEAFWAAQEALSKPASVSNEAGVGEVPKAKAETTSRPEPQAAAPPKPKKKSKPISVFGFYKKKP